MSLIFRYDPHSFSSEPAEHRKLSLDTRLNLLALEYGYRYRLDIRALNGHERVEFVRTLREARFIGIPIRQTGGIVKFYKIEPDGSLKRHNW